MADYVQRDTHYYCTIPWHVVGPIAHLNRQGKRSKSSPKAKNTGGKVPELMVVARSADVIPDVTLPLHHSRVEAALKTFIGHSTGLCWRLGWPWDWR